MTTLLEAALTYLSSGLSILPCRLPDKAPDTKLLPWNKKLKKHEWEPLKTTRASEDDARIWFSSSDPKRAVGIIAGRVSGNLEILDFDERAKFGPWIEMVKEQAPGLQLRLVAEESMRGGVHIFYRCETIEGNLKLARGLRKIGEEDKVKTLIETRGENGYCVVAPSPGYSAIWGKITEVQTITPEERDVLLQAARALDELPAPVDGPPLYSGPRQPGDGPRPGDDFNRSGDVRDVLTRNGWSLAHVRGDVSYWRRPGKERGGISATFGHVPGHLHVFSSNASPLEPEKSYSPFALYAILDCGGNFAEASKQLRKAGFGFEDPLPRGKADMPAPTDDEWNALQAAIPGSKSPSTGPLALVREADPEPKPARPDPELDGEDEDFEAPEPSPIVIALPCPSPDYPAIPEQEVIQYALSGEQGLGILAAKLLKDRFCLDRGANVWYRWGGHVWVECRLGEEVAALQNVQTLIRSVAIRKRLKTAPKKPEDGKKQEKQKALFDFLTAAADSLQKLVTTKHVLEYASSGGDMLGVAGDEWDQRPWLLPVANGVVNLRTRTLEEGRPGDHLKTASPVRYDPDAEAPRFDRFIREIMPDQATAQFLRRFLGYGLVGTIVEHVFPVFWGEAGRNGKDTLFEAVYNVLGALATPISAKVLIQQKYQPDHDSAMLDLRGRRLVWASESGERQPLDAAKVKLWTGGGTLKGRPPYGARQIEFKPTHKLVLITNFKPKIPPDDKALWQRMLLVPFNESFVDYPHGPRAHLVDRDLPAKLKEEQEGILAWLVRGCMEWQQVGLAPPDSVRGATKGYQKEEDALGSFLSDCTVSDPNSRVTTKNLYDRYVRWCDEDCQGKPDTAKAFTRGLKARSMEGVHGREGYFYPAIRLVTQAEDQGGAL